ncbi:MAG: hypothetical protein AAB353_09365 [Candidatus Hydrogenedentota bacterium]
MNSKYFRLLPAIIAMAAFAQDEGPAVTRADLAAAYQRVDGAFQMLELPGEEIAPLNKDFDTATLAFFQRRYGEAIKTINSVGARLLGAKSEGRVSTDLMAFRVLLDPPVYVNDKKPMLSATIESLYPPDNALDHEKLSVLLVREGTNEPVREFGFEIVANAGTQVKMMMTHTESESIPEGRYSVVLRTAQGDIAAGDYTVVDKSLDEAKAGFIKSLEGIKAGTPELEQAVASVRARANLLSDTPSPENTAQIVLNPIQLRQEIQAEIAALEKGNDPFKDRRGDHWRVIHTPDKDIPARVYLPAFAELSKPLTLVVAFHGAGVDENVFMQGYGAGEIKSLANKRGFLLVAPLTYDFGTNAGERFDALIDAIALAYPIDRARVYVLGHSMGGGMTASIAALRPDAIRAAACLCGFRGFGAATKTPPTLVVAAELDPLAQAKGVESAFNAAKAAGHNVEYKFMPNYGHTLVVGKVLPSTIDWLFAH